MKEKYYLSATTGDIVMMPSGTIGIIDHWDITLGGNCKEVRVYPFTSWLYRLFLNLTGKNWFYDEQINTLKPIHLAPNRT